MVELAYTSGLSPDAGRIEGSTPSTLTIKSLEIIYRAGLLTTIRRREGGIGNSKVGAY